MLPEKVVVIVAPCQYLLPIEEIKKCVPQPTPPFVLVFPSLAVKVESTLLEATSQLAPAKLAVITTLPVVRV